MITLLKNTQNQDMITNLDSSVLTHTYSDTTQNDTWKAVIIEGAESLKYYNDGCGCAINFSPASYWMTTVPNRFIKKIIIGNEIKTLLCGSFRSAVALKDVNFQNEGVEVIDQDAFGGCIELSNIVLGNSLSVINDYAFYRDEKLSSVVLPDSLESLGDSAFYDTGLTSIAIPKNVKKIGTFCFGAYCTREPYDMGEGGAHSNIVNSKCIYNTLNAKYIGNNHLSVVEFADGNTVFDSLGDLCFGACSMISSISLPKTIKKIGAACFAKCSALSCIDIPMSVTDIGAACFKDCVKLGQYKIAGDKSTALFTYGKDIINTDKDNSTLFKHSIPNLQDNTVFDNMYQDWKLLVPNYMYNKFITGNIWSQFADHIIAINPPNIENGVQVERNKTYVIETGNTEVNVDNISKTNPETAPLKVSVAQIDGLNDIIE